MRRFRFAVQPGWLALHAVSVALVVTMVLLGRWQLIVSDEKGFDLQNFGYALQWWAFSAFVVIMWGRAMRDALHKQDGGAPADVLSPIDGPAPADGLVSTNDRGLIDDRLNRTDDAALPEPRSIRKQTPSYRRYVMPTAETDAKNSDDPIHNAYNDFLSRLAASDKADDADGAQR